MSDSNVIPPSGHTEAKLLLWIALATVFWMVGVFQFAWLPAARIPTAYTLPIILGLCFFLTIQLARKGTAGVPLSLGAVGCFFILGGGTFDMVATVLHTPDLHDESNEVGRALLDSGHSLAFVYGYAILSQLLFLALVCTLWLSLLRHRNILIASLHGHSSFMPFVKAATGGAHLTWRQWILPLKMSELPRAYQLIWFVTVLLVAGMSERWYFGFEWFNVVSSGRWIVCGAALFIGLVIYFGWLWLASRRM